MCLAVRRRRVSESVTDGGLLTIQWSLSGSDGGEGPCFFVGFQQL